VRGLLAMILNVFSKATAREIIEAPLDFLQELGLESHLSPSRSNGVFAMIKQIRLYAQAFLIMEQAKK
jgi:cysteine desulfuration protein SufE